LPRCATPHSRYILPNACCLPGTREIGERLRILPIVRVLHPVPIVRAHALAHVHHLTREANFTGHSTDMEVNGSVVSAKKSVASQFSMKEYTVIRSLFRALKAGTKMLGVSAVGYVLAGAGMVQAQSSDPAPRPLPSSVRPTIAAPVTPNQTAPAVPIFDPMVVPASGCSGCGMSSGSGGCGYGGSNNSCVPGRHGCSAGDSTTVCGRFFGGLCEELCCPDPCYEPRWIPEANAAFFQDSPRPVTQTRIRWDAGYNYRFPDTAEYFQAQAKVKGPKFLTSSLRYDDLTLYQEVAAKGASFFIEIPYRTIEPTGGPGSSGMGDMNLGAKTVLLDRELLLVTMQFRTFIPTGNFTSGVGAGHASLEPSIMAALKLGPATYLQTELSEWIPLGGTPGFASSVFHYHFSLNQRLAHWGDCVNVVGVMEFNGYSFRGAFTDFPSGTVVGSSGGTFANAGPGIRVQFCDRADVGFAADFGFGNHHGPGQIYRTELRIRY
jgi:hypothetical protein